MNIETLQKDFPMLCVDDPVTYLDSAATSLTPTPVLEVMDEYYKTYRANVHRGLYREAERATEECEEARDVVARFIDASRDEIIFTSGATDSANKLFQSLEHAGVFSHDDEVVTTVLEHHATLLPLQRRVGSNNLLFIEPSADMTLSYDDADRLITDRTRLVVVMLASNVLGSVHDVARIARRAHEVGARVVVDATAAVGHMPVSVRELGADFLFFSGHKMCGPTGIGVLSGKREELEKLEPSMIGGGIVEEVTRTTAHLCGGPERFEAGTPNIAGIIGLKRAVRYLTDLGLSEVLNHTQTLVAYAQERLTAVDGVTLFSAQAKENIGIVSFSVEGVHPHDVATIAGKNRVALRAGHHCAMPLHTTLKVPATTRASVYCYNTERDIDRLVESVREVRAMFK